MISTEPMGTRRFSIRRPLGRTQPSMIWPTGSIWAAICSTSVGHAGDALLVEREAVEHRPSDSPASAPAAMSRALASRIRLQRWRRSWAAGAGPVADVAAGLGHEVAGLAGPLRARSTGVCGKSSRLVYSIVSPDASVP